MSSFEQQLHQWVSIDNQLRLLNDKIRVLREAKTKISESVFTHIKENNLSNSSIQISDDKLKFALTKVQQPLTFKYLEKSLSQIIKNESQVNQILNYLRDKRETKIVPEIKRITCN
jgi:hypothetical protein